MLGLGLIRISTLVLLVALAAATAYLTLRSDDERRCNGSTRLCALRLDQVTFAGTHNSMAASQEGWLFANQTDGIPAQLRAGIRALLIDTQYWEEPSSVTSTLRSVNAEALAPQITALLASRGPSQPGAQLCHTFCGLGHQPLVGGLAQIRSFLDANRDEVLIVIIEDYVSLTDIRDAFQRSGLERYAYTPSWTGPWPTLGGMIDRNQRLVVFSERQAGLATPANPTPDWYQPAFAYIQDTRFRYDSASSFDCALNRGSPGNALLLMNHWLERLAPDVKDAAAANAFDVIMSRVEQCRRQRGRAPNIIAVDHYEVGDLLRVVKQLNGG